MNCSYVRNQVYLRFIKKLFGKSMEKAGAKSELEKSDPKQSTILFRRKMSGKFCALGEED